MKRIYFAYLAIIAVPFIYIWMKNNVGDNKESTEKSESVKSEFYQQAPSSDTDIVYICSGPKSTKYHKTDDCMGLRRCSGDIEEMDLEEAEDDGYEPCRWCYEDVL